MKTTFNIKIRKDGKITLPAELCKRYDIQSGDMLNVVYEGDNSIILSINPSLDKGAIESLKNEDDK